jgi:hypothetical protein
MLHLEAGRHDTPTPAAWKAALQVAAAGLLIISFSSYIIYTIYAIYGIPFAHPSLLHQPAQENQPVDRAGMHIARYQTAH